MKQIIFSLAVLAACLITAVGCKKSSNAPSGGGTGGNATIIARAEHYGSLLDTAVVYIKYGTLNAPANGVYDDSLKAATNCNCVFSNLTPGSYYLFAEAIHDPYNPPTVDGGKPWTIGTNTETDTVTVGTTQQDFTFPAWW